MVLPQTLLLLKASKPTCKDIVNITISRLWNWHLKWLFRYLSLSKLDLNVRILSELIGIQFII